MGKMNPRINVMDDADDADMHPLMLEKGTNDDDDDKEECEYKAVPVLSPFRKYQAVISAIRNKKFIPLISCGSGGFMLFFFFFFFFFTDSSSGPEQEFNTNSIFVPSRPPGKLRLDWANIKPLSKIAHELTNQRTNCSLPLNYYEAGQGGLGNELHAYTFAMCLAHQMGVRLYTTKFYFMDPDVVQSPRNPKRNSMSVLDSYFTNLELLCEGDEDVAQNQQMAPKKRMKLDVWKLWRKRGKTDVCASIMDRPGFQGIYSNLDMRSSAIEAMFTAGLSPAIIDEAERQHTLVFPKGVPSSHQLITVHIRWGDKKNEMELVSIHDYIQSVYDVALAQNLKPNETHVFLATEDPVAVEAFQASMDPNWNLYIDQFFWDMLPHRNNVTQEVAGVANAGYGHVGLLAVGSLLVAMEANHYILTSASNWSRLINHLRRSIIRSHCADGNIKPGDKPYNDQGDCTSAIDLRKSDFWLDLDFDGGGV
jgi:hypothetical protein